MAHLQNWFGLLRPYCDHPLLVRKINPWLCRWLVVYQLTLVRPTSVKFGDFTYEDTVSCVAFSSPAIWSAFFRQLYSVQEPSYFAQDNKKLSYRRDSARCGNGYSKSLISAISAVDELLVESPRGERIRIPLMPRRTISHTDYTSGCQTLKIRSDKFCFCYLSVVWFYLMHTWRFYSSNTTNCWGILYLANAFCS